MKRAAVTARKRSTGWAGRGGAPATRSPTHMRRETVVSEAAAEDALWIWLRRGATTTSRFTVSGWGGARCLPADNVGGEFHYYM